MGVDYAYIYVISTSLVNMELASMRRKEYITMWRIVMFISRGNNGMCS